MQLQYRVVGARGWGGRSPPDFGRSVNPIQTMGGGQIIPTTLLLAPQIFRPSAILFLGCAQLWATCKPLIFVLSFVKTFCTLVWMPSLKFKPETDSNQGHMEVCQHFFGDF